MKTVVLAAFAALSLTAAIAPAAHAFTRGFPHPAQHQGAYDNTQDAERAPNISAGGEGGS